MLKRGHLIVWTSQQWAGALQKVKAFDHLMEELLNALIPEGRYLKRRKWRWTVS
jgi:hypothetical protein